MQTLHRPETEDYVVRALAADPLSCHLTVQGVYSKLYRDGTQMKDTATVSNSRVLHTEAFQCKLLCPALRNLIMYS